MSPNHNRTDDLWVCLSADGSQIELRALAELSNDPLLIRQFQEAALDRHNPLKDVHCRVGNMMTGWDIERIHKDKKTRRVCKNVHFGIAFGLGEDNAYPYVIAKIRAVDGPKADLTGITPTSIRNLHRTYFIAYPGVKRFIASQRRKAEELGYVETLFGFRRHIQQDDESRTTYWGNQAVNTPVQGTAHQFMLIALALLDLKPRTYNLLQRCIMEVHDALYFFVRLRDLPEAYKQLMHLFEVGAYGYAQRKFNLKLRVPLLAEATAGFCMGSMIDYGGATVEEFLPEWRTKQRELEAKSWEELMPQSIVPV